MFKGVWLMVVWVVGFQWEQDENKKDRGDEVLFGCDNAGLAATLVIRAGAGHWWRG